MSTLKEFYKTNARKNLEKKYNFANPHIVPEITRVVINVGLKEAVKDKQVVEAVRKDLCLISGQLPLITKAKKSVSNFKLREGQAIGLMLTLRRERMYDFLYKFIHIVSPRISDFRGFKKKGDKQGNYSFGLKELQSIFPEIELNKVKYYSGMQVTVLTNTNSEVECLDLLTELGFPFRKDKEK